MEQRGGEIIANMAHPTNTYRGCYYEKNSDHLLVKLEYKKCVTELMFYVIGDIFYKVEVLRDTDFYPTFKAVENIKSFLYQVMENEYPETVAAIEEKIGTKVRDMNGKQLACMALTLSWLSYKYNH